MDNHNKHMYKPHGQIGDLAMSTFSGKQGKGAMREHRKAKREAAEVRAVNPGARALAALAVELGVPMSTLAPLVDAADGWTVDERVNATTVESLRGTFGGAA